MKSSFDAKIACSPKYVPISPRTFIQKINSKEASKKFINFPQLIFFRKVKVAPFFVQLESPHLCTILPRLNKKCLIYISFLFFFFSTKFKTPKEIQIDFFNTPFTFVPTFKTERWKTKINFENWQ